MASIQKVSDVWKAYERLDENQKSFIIGVMQGILLSKDKKTPAQSKKKTDDNQKPASWGERMKNLFHKILNFICNPIFQLSFSSFSLLFSIVVLIIKLS